MILSRTPLRPFIPTFEMLVAYFFPSQFLFCRDSRECDRLKRPFNKFADVVPGGSDFLELFVQEERPIAACD